MRIVHYYPRALIGDGGMTGAVRHLSVALSEAGAETVIAYDEGPQPPSDDRVHWAPVRHIGPSRERLPLPAQLEPALRGADLVVLNSAWAAHNVVAGRVARKLGVAYVLAPRGAYEEQIFNRRRPVKRLWWAALEGPLVRRARAMHIQNVSWLGCPPAACVRQARAAGCEACQLIGCKRQTIGHG